MEGVLYRWRWLDHVVSVARQQLSENVQVAGEDEDHWRVQSVRFDDVDSELFGNVIQCSMFGLFNEQLTNHRVENVQSQLSTVPKRRTCEQFGRGHRLVWSSFEGLV
jgi:hypothetical protein